MPFDICAFSLCQLVLLKQIKCFLNCLRRSIVHFDPSLLQDPKRLRSAVPGKQCIHILIRNSFSSLNPGSLSRRQILLIVNHCKGFLFQIID